MRAAVPPCVFTPRLHVAPLAAALMHSLSHSLLIWLLLCTHTLWLFLFGCTYTSSSLLSSSLVTQNTLYELSLTDALGFTRAAGGDEAMPEAGAGEGGQEGAGHA